MQSLKELSLKYDTDKSTAHNYTHIYETYLSNFKNKRIKLLEIGIGGYSSSSDGGGSLKMWRDYFKKGKIAGLDIEDKFLKLGKRVHIFKGSQESTKDLSKIIKLFKNFDFIIDDGSHLNNHQIRTFEILFPYLKNGGFYFIEDIQTSYMLKYGGDGFYLNNRKTAINYFKSLIDKINHQEIENPFFKADYFSKNITEIHFYHNLIVIKKEKNIEKSNILVNNFKYPKGKNLLPIRKKIKFTKYLFHQIRAFIYKILDKLKI